MFQIIRRSCCGLDVHKETVWACLMMVQPDGTVAQTKLWFATMTNELLKLRDWLEENNCKDVVMESTGVYWKPVYNLLEDIAEITLANAQHVKQVPGRKTDQSDCEWLAQLHLCGLIRSSFVPPRPFRDLRDLTRRRRKLINEASAEKNRIQKTLEDANIKLSSVVSDIWGLSSRDMIDGLIGGGYSPKEMASWARGRMRCKIPELQEALTGRITDHHSFVLTQCMKHITFLEEQIAELEDRIDQGLKAHQEVYDCLMSIPFFNQVATMGFMAEMGINMSIFPTAAHAASWASLSPGNHQSAGKRKNVKCCPGNKHLQSLAVEVAWAAVRRKDCYLGEKFKRIAYRRGKQKAIIAVAHSIIKIVYHIIKERVCYIEPERKPPTEKQKQHIRDKHLRALERLGYKVELSSEMQPQIIK